MSPFRPVIDFARQMWFALDTVSAVRHGGPLSEGTRRHCMTTTKVQPQTAETAA